MVRNFSSYDEWKKAQEEKEKSITDNVKNSGMGTDQSSGQQRTFKSYDEWKEVNRPEEYRKEQAELLKEEIERPRKEYEAKVQEFDTKIQEEKDSKWWNKKIKISDNLEIKPFALIPSKKEKELVAQKAEFTAQTHNKKYSQEYRDKILAEKPKEIKLSDEQYLAQREQIDYQLQYLNSVKSENDKVLQELDSIKQFTVKQKGIEGDQVRNTPFLPTKELVAQTQSYNTESDWSEAYNYLKEAAKKSGVSEEEYARSYNAMVASKMAALYERVTGEPNALTKEQIVETSKRTGLPAVRDDQIRMEIENINQYLDRAKNIYDEYTGVKEVAKVTNLLKKGELKEGLGLVRDEMLGGNVAFMGDYTNPDMTGLQDIVKIKEIERKLQEGIELTPNEKAKIVLMSALQVNDQIDRGLLTRLFEGAADNIKLVSEMALTAGIFSAAGKATQVAGKAISKKVSYMAAKEMVEAAAEQGGKSLFKTIAAKGYKEGAKTIMKGVAVGLIAEIPETIAKDSLKIAAEVVDSNKPIISFSDPETEKEFIKIIKDDESYQGGNLDKIAKAFARQYFNNAIERGGGEVPDALVEAGTSRIKNVLIAKYLSQKGIQTLEEFSKVYDAVGLDGMVGEVFEEYAQDYAESIIDNRDFIIDDPDKFWDIVASVGVMQMGRAGSVVTTVTDVTKNLITGKTFETDQQVPPVDVAAPVDTRVGQDVDTLITKTQTEDSIQEDLETKAVVRQQQVSGDTQTILTEPVDDATLLRKAQALSDISKQTDYSLSSLTELKKLEKQATDEKTAQAIATISDSYANVLAKKIADGSVNIGQQIDTQLQDNIKEISPDETVQEGIKTTKQQILETPNKEYFVQEKGKFKEIKDAKSIKIINEADTFIYRDPESKLYQVVEAKSGMAIAEASTRSAAVEQATAKLNKMGVETFQSKIQEAISKKGVSPRYIKKEVKKVAKKEILKKEVTGAAKESMQVESKQLAEDAKKLSKADFVKEFGYLFDYEDSPYKVSAEEFYDNATGEKSPIEKAGLKVGSKIKVQGKLREVSDFGKSARDSQGVLVRFTDGTYITLDKAQEYAAQKQTKDAVKKESTEKTKEAIKEAEETVKKIEKEKKVDQNQLAKRRMDIGKTNPEVRKISKDLKDFQESEDYVALKDEYKILLKEAGVTHSSLESYIDNMIDMYGEEAATYLEDLMQRWTAAQEVIQDLMDKKSELINQQLVEEGFKFRKQKSGRYVLDSKELNEMDLKKMKEISKEILGDTNIEIMESILTPSRMDAMGRYMANWIQIRAGSIDKGSTFYHEAVHKALDIFLTPQEKALLIKEVRKSVGDEKLIEMFGDTVANKKFRLDSYEVEAKRLYREANNKVRKVGIGLEAVVKNNGELKKKENELKELARYTNISIYRLSGAALKQTTEQGNVKYVLIEGEVNTTHAYALLSSKELGRESNYQIVDISEVIGTPFMNINKEAFNPSKLSYSKDESLRSSQREYRSQFGITKKGTSESIDPNIYTREEVANYLTTLGTHDGNGDIEEIGMDDYLITDMLYKDKEYELVDVDVEWVFENNPDIAKNIKESPDAYLADRTYIEDNDNYDSPIIIGSDGEIIDGTGRLTGHYLNGDEKITAYVGVEKDAKYRGREETSLDDMAEEWLAENIILYINKNTPKTFTEKIKASIDKFIDRWFRTMDNIDTIENFYKGLLSGRLLKRQRELQKSYGEKTSSMLGVPTIFQGFAKYKEDISKGILMSEYYNLVEESKKYKTFEDFKNAILPQNNNFPNILYHGTNEEFDMFKSKEGKRSYGIFGEEIVKTNGMFLTVNKEYAKNYGKNVVKVYPFVKNPLIGISEAQYGELTDQKLKDANYIFEPIVEWDTYEDGNGNKKESAQIGTDMIVYEQDYTGNKELPLNWINRFIGEDGGIDWRLLDNPEVTNRLVEKGYDGLLVQEDDGEGLSYFVPLKNKVYTESLLSKIWDKKSFSEIKYRADLLFDEEAEVEEKKPKKETTLEITKTPEKGVVYDTKGTSILPSRKLQQQIEETLMSGQSTPATRSVTAFMPVIETAGKIKDSRAFEKIQDRYAEIQELDPSMNELKYKSMSIADITAKAMAFVDEYPVEARRVALGMELAPEGTTDIAVSLAYTEKMFEEGKWKQAREADRATSLKGTRYGQEIVSFQGRLNANSPMHFVDKVIEARKMAIGQRSFSMLKGFNVKGVVKSFVGDNSRYIDEFNETKKKETEKIVKTLKQIKLEKAEDFINKLIC